MELEGLDLSKVKMTHMVIGNNKGWLMDIDLTKSCKGKDCVTISYDKDGTAVIS